MMSQATFLIERACVRYRKVRRKALDLKPGCRLPQHEIARKSEKTALFFFKKNEERGREKSEAMSIGSNIRALTKTHKEAWKDGEKEFKTFHISRKEGQRDHPTPRAQKGREKRILLARLRFRSRRRRV